MLSAETVIRFQKEIDGQFSQATHKDLRVGLVRQPYETNLFIVVGRRTSPEDFDVFDVSVGTIGDIQPLEGVESDRNNSVWGSRRNIFGENETYEVLLTPRNMMASRRSQNYRDNYEDAPVTDVPEITLQ